MLTHQKLRELLLYVWNPKIDLNHPSDVEKLNQLVLQIDDLLASREGSEAVFYEFLNNQSIQNFNADVLLEKSAETAQLIMNWYVPIPAIWTDYGRVSIQKSQSRFFDQDYFVYQSKRVNEYIPFDYIGRNKISIAVRKLDCIEAEKSQLLDAISALIKPCELVFSDIDADH